MGPATRVAHARYCRAMSQENVELVKRLLEMFARREHEAVFAFYDSDIEWDASNFGMESAAGVPDDLQGIYHGHEGVRTYWRRWLQAWADLEFEVDDVLEPATKCRADPQSAAVGAAQWHRD